MNVFVYSTFTREEQQQLKNALPVAVKLTFRTDLQKSAISAAMEAAEIILGNPPLTLFKANMPQLKFWQIDSSGFDQYKSLHINIPVANMGDFFAISCAETIVGGLLSFYRKLSQLALLQASEQWNNMELRKGLQNLSHKKVLILGNGTIAKATKKMLSGFNCQVKTTARNHPDADLHRHEEILALLPEIDLVINTLPGTADRYVSTQFIDNMKQNAVYANVGRGNTTDEAALIHALESKKLAGAVLDVTTIEPIPPGHVLWKMDNVILTQHTGGGNQAEAQGKIKQFVNNFERFSNRDTVESLVQLNQGY